MNRDNFFEEDCDMTQYETTNIIIKLKEKGFTNDEVLDVIAFAATHRPSEEEVKAALALGKSTPAIA